MSQDCSPAGHGVPALPLWASVPETCLALSKREFNPKMDTSLLLLWAPACLPRLPGEGPLENQSAET